MKHLSASEFREVVVDIEVELGKLVHLRQEIEELSQLINAFPQLTHHLYENQAFKLHNFYNGCERIFRIIASELNGALPSAYDWHRRLLERMTVPHAGRPALISVETARL